MFYLLSLSEVHVSGHVSGRGSNLNTGRTTDHVLIAIPAVFESLVELPDPSCKSFYFRWDSLRKRKQKQTVVIESALESVNDRPTRTLGECWSVHRGVDAVLADISSENSVSSLVSSQRASPRVSKIY